MRKKKSTLILRDIFKKVAPRIGAKVFFEPKWGIVSQITFKNGKRRYSRHRSIDINPMGASEVSIDKEYATFFMNKMGYPTIEGKAFCAPYWARAISSRESTDQAYKYAKKLGFPVIVKPNSGSQGSNVALVSNKTEFYKAINKVFKGDRMALVQRKVNGKDYRIVVLDKKVISAYERIPLSVVGDGNSSIKQLFEKKKRSYMKIKRDMFVEVNDIRIKSKLKSLGRTLKSVLAQGEQVFLLDNANLSTGGDSIDVTAYMHKDFKNIAVNLTRDMGLRLCGVDLMIDGDIKEKKGKYWVIEVNSAPGLDHYVTTGKVQQKIVEDMYLEVLKAMAK